MTARRAVPPRGSLAARTARTVRAAATAAMTTGLVLLPASAALASNRPDDGSEPGSGLSVIETLFWFVLVPGGLFVLIALLVSAPGMARGPRYRPGLGWWAAPVWFNGPDDADNAVRKATATAGGGGASARW